MHVPNHTDDLVPVRLVRRVDTEALADRVLVREEASHKRLVHYDRLRDRTPLLLGERQVGNDERPERADLLHRIVARRIAAALERHAQRREELRRRRALTELSAGKRDPTRNANRLMALAGDEQVVDEAGGAHIGYRLQMHDEIVHGLFSGSCPSRRDLRYLRSFFGDHRLGRKLDSHR